MDPEIVVEGSNSNNYEPMTSENDDNCSGYQSTDFQTAYENQSAHPNYQKNKSGGDSISENDQSNFQDKINKIMADGGDAHSANISRRGSFSITTASEIMNHNEIDSEITSAINDQGSTNDTTSQVQGHNHANCNHNHNHNHGSKFKLNATPFLFQQGKKVVPAANAQ
jgi:hypothetical protein